ncbi:MAG: elongation factor G [Anaerolineales bacterium]
MKTYDAANIRNIAIAGHQGSGKTSLLEAFAFLTGVTSRMGKVEENNTLSDFDEEEQARNMSINTSVIPIEVDDIKLNLLDTPGFTDFQGEVQQAIRVSDAVLVVVDAVAGPEVGTELAFQFADNFEQPILVAINKMDRENASFTRTLEALCERFPEHKFIPVFLPIGEQADFKGVAGALTQKAYYDAGRERVDLPDEMVEAVEQAHLELIEAAAEADDAYIEKYFETGELTFDEARDGMRKAAKNADLKTIPVFVCSATHNIGTYHLLEALSLYVSPAENRRVAMVGEDGEREFLTPPQRDDGKLAGYIFKEYTDKFGTLSYFRLFSGRLKSNDTVFIPSTGVEERFGQLLVMRGKEQIQVDEIRAGDIGAVAKLKETHVGATIAAKGETKRLLSPPFREPVYAVAVHPKTQADGAKLGPTLAAVADADQTLHWRNDPVTKETLLEGMGGIQIEVAIKKAARLGCHIETSVPKIPYQETVTGMAEAEYTHKKQTGGAGQYGRVNLRVESSDPNEEFTFSSEVFGGAVSQQFIGSTEKGVRQALEEGVIAGFPVVGVKAIIFDGKMHPVDSKDIAFQIAGREAFREAVMNAKPTLLEPLMNVRITIPEDNMGDIMSDMTSRRGIVQGMDTEAGRSVVTAVAPLAEMQRYSDDLRSITSGRGVFQMSFSHYEKVPQHIADEIIAAHRAEKQEA